MPQKSHSEQTPICDDFGFFTNKKRNQGNQAIKDACPFKSSLFFMISFQNFKIKPQKKIKNKTRSDHSCALLIPSIIDGLQSLSPCVPYFVISKLSLGLEIDHFPSFQTCFPSLPGKLSTVCTFFEFSLQKVAAPHLWQRKQHLARWLSPGHQLLLCLTGSRNKSGNAIWNSLADKPWKLADRTNIYIHVDACFARPAKWVFALNRAFPALFKLCAACNLALF